jgi:DNA-binding GntR family transcriptional regulator
MSESVVIRPLAVPIGRRRAAVEVHAHIRDLILKGELPPNMTLAQTEIARALGVGVSSVREAFRMLQQEGLIDAKPDQRAFVVPVDPSEQDQLFAQRVLLEALACRMNAGRLTAEELEGLEVALRQMSLAGASDDYPAWVEAHYDFHRVSNKYAGEGINQRIRALTDQTTRYMLIHGRRLPHSYDEAFADHAAVLSALREGDPDEAQQVSGIHVGRPALVLLAQLVPSFEPSAVRSALGMIGVDRYVARPAFVGRAGSS